MILKKRKKNEIKVRKFYIKNRTKRTKSRKYVIKCRRYRRTIKEIKNLTNMNSGRRKQNIKGKK